MKLAWTDRTERGNMKRILMILLGALLIFCSQTLGADKLLDIKGNELISHNPPLQLVLPSELRLVHTLSTDHPRESSRTRAYFLIKEQKKQVEDLLILQIAEKTNPQAEPMTTPPLKPSSEERMYFKGHFKKELRQIDYLSQLMMWNPEAATLKPLIEKGLVVPSHLALQGQILFLYDTEHAVLLWYSRDVQTFGMKVSERDDHWKKGSISGNEKKAVDAFQNSLLTMIESIQFEAP
jgi:hypothetical protein